MDFLKENSKIWDERSANADRWSVPVSSEEVALARQGQWSILLTPTKPVPRDWFPKELAGKNVLCLASGGGQQGPIMAATGASVTVFDNSRTQLDKDLYVAERDGLKITTVQGNMQDLSSFSDESFDLVINPWSNSYIDNVLPVWKECARILKKGGILIAGFSNGVECIFDPVKFEQGVLSVEYKLPYADVDHLDNPGIKRIAEAEGYIWGHTLTDQIGGQIDAGFAIVGFYEDRGGTPLDGFMSGSIATKAVKM
ncbi:MAG: class I SAM-dependent methyltransferase [Lachnospiraceae bacterium]|nr:class I SAM-dependent methyltransferase [Lachnospiraceae bacterium]